MPAPSPDCENHLRRHLANPFLVLELAPEAGRSELERQGARLLAMLAAGLAGRIPTPRRRSPRPPE